jgi:hypothetical protein
MVMNNSPPVTSTSSPNSALSSAGVRGQCTTLHYYSPHPAASQHEGQSTQCLSTTYEAPPCYSHVYNYQNPQQQQQQRNSSLQHLHQQIAPTAIQMPPDVPQCQNFSGHGLNPKISLQTNQQSRGPPFNTNYYQPLPMQANPMPTQPYNGTYQNTALPQLHAPTGEQYNQFDVSVPMVEKHVPIEVGNNSFSRQDTCSIPTTPMTAPFSSSNE